MLAIKSLHYIFVLTFIYCSINIYSLPSENNITNARVLPQQVKVGPFFKGSQAIITAELPECSGVVVKLIGKHKEIVLNEKGKKVWSYGI